MSGTRDDDETGPADRTPALPSELAATGPDYEVGYGRPPKASRFKKGQSGNLRGRPKSRLSASEALSRELDEKICVREGGKTLWVSKRDAAMKRLVADAMAGRKYAMDAVLAHERAIAERSGEALQNSNEDAAILERFVARMGAAPTRDGVHEE
ncbi:MAG: DUF5681 domain-containing protein [Burkholderiales bacterium]|nr:DUF5681 domain-containing protein [Burkholderiales bacterium]